MRRATIVGLVCWGLAAYGALCVADVPVDSHELCGPWGCLPPVQALVAMHLFWGLLLVLPVVWLTTHLNFRLLGVLGTMLMVASGLALACLIGSDLPSWLEVMPPTLRDYWGRRVLAIVAVHTDLPLVQLFLAGAACWLKSRLAKRVNAGRIVNGSVDGKPAEIGFSHD
jgi:hypothetical protein